jgi:hypothetical protein
MKFFATLLIIVAGAAAVVLVWLFLYAAWSGLKALYYIIRGVSGNNK